MPSPPSREGGGADEEVCASFNIRRNTTHKHTTTKNNNQYTMPQSNEQHQNPQPHINVPKRQEALKSQTTCGRPPQCAPHQVLSQACQVPSKTRDAHKPYQPTHRPPIYTHQTIPTHTTQQHKQQQHKHHQKQPKKRGEPWPSTVACQGALPRSSRSTLTLVVREARQRQLSRSQP